MNNPQWEALSLAWDQVVVLPDGWRLRSIERNGTEVELIGGRREYVEWWEATARGPQDQEITEQGVMGPVHAIFMLIEAVQERDAAERMGRAIG